MARLFRRNRPPAVGSAPSDVPAAPRPPLEPDPDRIGISGSVPFARLPDPEIVFRDRAARLAALAADHPLGAYLAFLARIVEAQARVAVAGRPPIEAPPDAGVRIEHGMPPLARDLVDAPDFAAILDALLAEVDLEAMPPAARAARDGLVAADSGMRRDLALQVFEGAFPVEQVAACTFVAAALQVHLARHAAALDVKALKAVADGVCPACGGPPVASLVVGWTPADKARYLACALCSTLWNHVRIRCTACGAGDGVSYYGLDEVSKDVQVETCTACGSYIKHLHQHRDPALDAIADDVASYGLDLKVAEEGEFRRAGLNPLFLP